MDRTKPLRVARHVMPSARRCRSWKASACRVLRARPARRLAKVIVRRRPMMQAPAIANAAEQARYIGPHVIN